MPEGKRLPLSQVSRFRGYVRFQVNNGTLTASHLEKLVDDLDFNRLTREASTSVALTIVIDRMRKFVESPGFPRDQAKDILQAALERRKRIDAERLVTTIETRPPSNTVRSEAEKTHEREVVMTKCFACAHGLTACTPSYVPTAASSGDILGVCWECHVMGCYEHAERDATSGKWMCFPSIASALFSSAQQQAGAPVPASPADQPFARSADFEARFPALSNASRALRMSFRERSNLLWPTSNLGSGRITNDAGELLADALGVAEFIVYGSEEFRPTYIGRDEFRAAEPMAREVARAVLTRDLAEMLIGSRNA
jgi:hypothetical protein